MKAASRKPSDEMRLSNKEFDRIMGRVLQVKPAPKTQKNSAKAKTPRKKASAGK